MIRKNGKWFVVISIHAPHEGCDKAWKPICLGAPYFNPRTP